MEDYYRLACEKFDISSLKDFQKECVEQLIRKRDVFLSVKTGSGKSLCYQAFFIIWRAMNEASKCQVLVVTPLISIMKEQCDYLSSLGLRSTYLGKDTSEDSDILNERYDFVFSSPENLLNVGKWRQMLEKTDSFRLMVVDEAHTVLHWGEADRDDEPFRVWYGRLSEARSLIKCPVLLITATANKSARKKMQKKFAMQNCCELIDNPDRPNIKLFVQQYKRTVPIERVLEQLIHLVKEKQRLCDRYIVFCPSIALSSKVFTAFRLEIGDDKIRHVEMYHSKTTDQTKEKIRKDLNDPNGEIRILVATSAAGMGVNFVGVHYVINFGPPRDMDSFVQQLGRCGRDGTQAMAMLIFNKAQCRDLDSEMKDYVNNKSLCRRHLILKTYNAKSEDLTKHLCCDICENTCDCKSDQCKASSFPIVYSEHDPEEVDSDTACDDRISSSSSNMSESETESLEI